MKIAQVAPLFESVPPQAYGGTERVVSYLTEQLVQLGHEVTLFASGDSVTAAELVPVCPRSLRLSKSPDPLALHFLMLQRVFSRASEFDFIHFHIDYFHFPLPRRNPVPQATTLHGRLDLPDLPSLYAEFRDMPVVSISDAQRAPLPFANWQATVYHGLPETIFRFSEDAEDYFAFIGRISPEKGVDRAIEIARRVGRPLKIAAKVDRVDRHYFNTKIKPLLGHSLIEFVGEVTHREKEKLLGGACGLLFPIDWPEPFGLVMIEALACGTPVLAFRCGASPEVIDAGVTGRMVGTEDEAVRAIPQLLSLDRKKVRSRFEQRFSSAQMAREYVSIYQQLC